jgi:hypothetical protein
MSELTCRLCGAELLPATSFCRQCGSEITDTNVLERSEAPTMRFSNPAESATTQRLDPRPTSPDRGLHPPAASMGVSSASRGRSKTVVSGFVLVLIIVGILTTVVVVRMRNANGTPDAVALIYPGSQTVVDMTNTDGSRTTQLQTKEPLARVESWYQTNVKLSKTVRLTSTSVVMKKDKVTITLAEEDGTTNILIKQAP